MTHDHDQLDSNHVDGEVPRWRRHLAESAIGLVIALLLLWVAVAAVTDVPFVYQGL
ncbi:MAG: hypothetical protein AAFP84_03160 [Actinomycetota bacterium]